MFLRAFGWNLETALFRAMPKMIKRSTNLLITSPSIVRRKVTLNIQSMKNEKGLQHVLKALIWLMTVSNLTSINNKLKAFTFC